MRKPSSKILKSLHFLCTSFSVFWISFVPLRLILLCKLSEYLYCFKSSPHKLMASIGHHVFLLDTAFASYVYIKKVLQFTHSAMNRNYIFFTGIKKKVLQYFTKWNNVNVLLVLQYLSSENTDQETLHLIGVRICMFQLSTWQRTCSYG